MHTLSRLKLSHAWEECLRTRWPKSETTRWRRSRKKTKDLRRPRGTEKMHGKTIKKDKINLKFQLQTTQIWWPKMPAQLSATTQVTVMCHITLKDCAQTRLKISMPSVHSRLETTRQLAIMRKKRKLHGLPNKPPTHNLCSKMKLTCRTSTVNKTVIKKQPTRMIRWPKTADGQTTTKT